MAMVHAVMLGLVMPIAPIGADVHIVEVGLNGEFTFTPAEITVEEGDTVTWINRSGCHDVRADDSSFFSGPIDCLDWEFSHVFAPGSAGVHPYYCSAHSFPGGTAMNGVITVLAGPSPLIFADGFEALPP